jgi:phosphoglycolate phosphatase
MKPKAVIWDMDGTILNTLDDLYISTNASLKYFNIPEISYDETRRFLGNGLKVLMKNAVKGKVNTDSNEFERLLEYFKGYYNAHSDDNTRPYDGVITVMKKLKEAGIKQAVVSNKIDEAVKSLSEKYFPNLIDIAIGESEGINRKPAPDSVYEACRNLGVSVKEAVYIGDSDVDYKTAKNSGMDLISVLWGFRTKEELADCDIVHFAEKPEDIITLLDI